MPRYRCGQVGPVPLEDGRVVTDEEPFDLEVESDHDQMLVDNGTIVLVEDPAPVAPAEPKAKADTKTAVVADEPKGA